MTRRPVLVAVGLAGAVAIAASARPEETPVPRTYVIVHGAWGGGWAFRKVDELLTARGQKVHRATLTGQGERVHLATPEVSLTTHVSDVVNMLLFEELRDVILVGHSYGGMVISGVAEKVPDRIRHLVYVDAMVLENGESLMTAAPGREARSAWLTTLVNYGFVVPPWVRPDQAAPKDVPQSLRTFTEPLVLESAAALAIKATYILTVEAGKEQDDFSPFAERARARGWTVLEMTADHNPQWSAPEALVELLAGIR